MNNFFMSAMVLLFLAIGFGHSVFADEIKDQINKDEVYGLKSGLMGDFVIGPKVSLGLPVPLGFGIEGKYANIIGFGFDYHLIPTLTVKTAKVNFKSYSGTVRVFPWRRALFFGLKVGQQTLSGSKSETIYTIPTTANVEVNTLYLTPHMGWRWTWGNGFYLGMELGVQVAASANTNVSTNINHPIVLTSAEYLKIKKDVTDIGDKIGKLPLPHIALFQMGFYF